MEDKLTNLLIFLIVIAVICLAILYCYRLTDGNFNIIINTIKQEISEDDDYYEEPISSTDVNSENENTEVISTEIIEKTQITADVNENANSTTTEQDTNTSIISTYYYDQLEIYAKVIYNAIATNIDNLKTGNYTININYDFSNLLDEEDGSDRINDYYSDAINAINLDRAELFYIDFTKMYLNIETRVTVLSTTYTLYLDAGDNGTYYTSGFYSQEDVENAMNEIDEVKKEILTLAVGTDYDKLKTIHDWLIDNLSYSSSALNGNDIYGALKNKSAVCEGYARAYKYLLDELGIENVLIVGSATNSNNETEDHMWNYVKLNETWYAVDVTWDDPIVTGGGTASYEILHKYFLVGSTTFLQNHVEKQEISTSGKIFELPILNEGDYN